MTSNGLPRGGARLRSAKKALVATTYVVSFLRSLKPYRIEAEIEKYTGNLLCDFILSRTEDGDGIGACAKALLALEERGKWDAGKVQDIMETYVCWNMSLDWAHSNGDRLLANTSPLRQYKQQSERYPVLRLIDALLARYRDGMSHIAARMPMAQH